MARKHFDDYYNKIFSQYEELTDVVKQMSEEVSQGMVSPERLEAAKATLAPIVTSFQTVSYIKYLLDMPKRKNKLQRYNKKLLKQAGDKKGENVLKNNQKILDEAHL